MAPCFLGHHVRKVVWPISYHVQVHHHARHAVHGLCQGETHLPSPGTQWRHSARHRRHGGRVIRQNCRRHGGLARHGGRGHRASHEDWLDVHLHRRRRPKIHQRSCQSHVGQRCHGCLLIGIAYSPHHHGIEMLSRGSPHHLQDPSPSEWLWTSPPHAVRPRVRCWRAPDALCSPRPTPSHSPLACRSSRWKKRKWRGKGISRLPRRIRSGHMVNEKKETKQYAVAIQVNN